MKVDYHHDRHKVPRRTARGIIINGGSILLIERRRGTLHYFSFPGGGVDDGETDEQTVKREVAEETSVKVEVKQQLYDYGDQAGNIHAIFLCRYKSGEPSLRTDSEEAESMKKTNQKDSYEPKWMQLNELAKIPFEYWAPVAERLVYDLKHGWSDKIIKLHAKP